jgi:hypothetical protein
MWNTWAELNSKADLKVFPYVTIQRLYLSGSNLCNQSVWGVFLPTRSTSDPPAATILFRGVELQGWVEL